MRIASFYDRLFARFRTTSGTDYDLSITGPDYIQLSQIKDGRPHGLGVILSEGRLFSLARFENGKAVGRALFWFENIGDTNGCVLEMNMQAPIDWFRYTAKRIKKP